MRIMCIEDASGVDCSKQGISTVGLDYFTHSVVPHPAVRAQSNQPDSLPTSCDMACVVVVFCVCFAISNIRANRRLAK